MKTVLWIIALPFILVILAIAALQFSSVQNYVTAKASGYLSSKIHSKVQLGKIGIAFPKSITLDELYLEDQKKDTLFYGHHISVNLNLWDLLSKKIDLSSVELETVTGHISRGKPGSDFNFSFIPQAFVSKDNDKPAVKTDSTASAWKFSIGSVSLKHIYFTYHDLSSGMNADLLLGEFKTGFDKFDMDKKEIHVKDITLKNTSATVVQEQALQTKEKVSDSTSFDFDIAVKTIKLDGIKAAYTDKTTGQEISTELGTFLLELNTLDLAHETIKLDNLLLHNTKLSYTQNKNLTKKSITTKITETTKPFAWTLDLKKLDLDSNTISYNDNTKAPLKKGMDLSHLLATQLRIKGTDLHVNEKNTKLDLEDISFSEHSGFELKKFKAKIVYDSTHAELSKLVLQTGNSSINDHVGVRYRSLQQLKDSIQNVEVHLSFEKTSVAIKDVLYFAPGLLKTPQVNDNKNAVVHLEGKVDGTLNDLSISKFELRTGTATRVKLNGTLKNVTDPKKLYAAASFEVNGSKKDLTALVPDSLLPKSIDIPESFSITGTYKGYVKNFDADVALKSSIGAASVSVNMNPKAGNSEQPYSAKIGLSEFDLGRLLNQSKTLGTITMTAAVKGSGFDTSNLKADLDVAIQKAVFKNYAYKDFTLNGSLSKRSFSGTAAMKDENLDFTYNGTIDLDAAHPKYTFTLDLNGADLKALNLSDEDFRISLLLQSDISSTPGQNPTGKASIKNALVIRNNHKYPVDSLVLKSDVKDGVSDISLTSEIFTADFNGSITLADLPETIKKQINSYFNLQDETTARSSLPKQDFKFDIKLLDPTLITGNLVPKMQKLTPFAIAGSYKSDIKNIELHTDIPQIQYDSITVDSLRIDITSDNTKLNYSVKVAELSNPTFKFENMFLGGDLKNNTLGFRFNTAKDDSAKLVDIGGVLKSIDREFELKLDEALILNTQKWSISNDNYIRFAKQGLYANDVTLTNGAQSLSLNSKEKSPQAPLEITFKNFDIATVARMIENKKELLAGTMNGNVTFEKQNGASAFRSDIELKDFAFKGVPVGTIKLKADNFENPDKYDVDLNIAGNGNTIGMKGYYSAGKNSELNFLLDVSHLNLSSVEPFTFSQVTRMSGSINGQLKIKGSVSQPSIDGDLNFKEAAFRPGFINSYLTVHNSKITFDNRKIRFNNFILNDSLKHTASVDGTIDMNDMKRMALDLHIKTDDFLAMNTNKRDNPLYYGTIIIDSDIHVKGSSLNPVVNGKIKLNKGSTVTYIKPEDQVVKNESKGVVEFVNNHPDKNIAIMARRNDSLNGISSTKGIDLSASIDVDKTVLVKMIVDPATGDSLFIRGGGLLDFNLDPSGKMSLSGKYRINDGGYYLALEGVVKRSFSIQKGSTVTWSGDLLDAYVDMTAIYTLKTSPLDLVQDELSGSDELERNKYRNLLTFNVYLKMTGFISSPMISFDIQLAPEDRGALNGAVNGKLAELREDETQLNKQVFALLTLRRFIGENPLESSGGGGGISSASRSSASQVLTSELTALSGKYINFVNLDLGVNSFEDYSTGQEQGRTQLQLGVSKQLFKDKVSVRVGGNVDLEGERAQQNDINDVAGNVNVDYKLTSDGRYKLKGFRENQYENPIEGELIRTGAGVLYVRNFNTLKQLFSKPPKEPVRVKEPDKDNDEDNK